MLEKIINGKQSFIDNKFNKANNISISDRLNSLNNYINSNKLNGYEWNLTNEFINKYTSEYKKKDTSYANECLEKLDSLKQAVTIEEYKKFNIDNFPINIIKGKTKFKTWDSRIDEMINYFSSQNTEHDLKKFIIKTSFNKMKKSRVKNLKSKIHKLSEGLDCKINIYIKTKNEKEVNKNQEVKNEDPLNSIINYKPHNNKQIKKNPWKEIPITDLYSTEQLKKAKLNHTFFKKIKNGYRILQDCKDMNDINQIINNPHLEKEVIFPNNNILLQYVNKITHNETEKINNTIISKVSLNKLPKKRENFLNIEKLNDKNTIKNNNTSYEGTQPEIKLSDLYSESELLKSEKDKTQRKKILNAYRIITNANNLEEIKIIQSSPYMSKEVIFPDNNTLNLYFNGKLNTNLRKTKDNIETKLKTKNILYEKTTKLIGRISHFFNKTYHSKLDYSYF